MENNVIELNPQSGYDDIMFYLNGLEAENTLKNYTRSIEDFVNEVFEIDIKHVQPHHFNNLTYTQMKKYRDKLRKVYLPSTTNNRMISLYQLFKELNKIERDGEYIYSINVDRLRVKSLRVSEVNSSGDITWEEVNEWIEYLKTSDAPNADLKIAFLHLSRITGLRKEALANLTYRDIRKSGDVWQIKSTLKGKTKKVSIKNDDAEMLFSIWKNKSNKDEKVLKMSTKTMDRLMITIRREFDIPEERNVTIHSLRGLSIFESYLATNSMLAAQEHAGHSNMETTYGYVKSRIDTVESPTLYMGKVFSEEGVSDLNKEDWTKLYAELSRSAKYEIDRAMKKLGYSQ